MFGSVSENLYDYENEMLRREMELMADIMWQRSSLISQNLPIQPEGYDENERCNEAHTAFSVSMQGIKAILADDQYYDSPGSVSSLLEQLDDANDIYSDMLSLGCIYMVE